MSVLTCCMHSLQVLDHLVVNWLSRRVLPRKKKTATGLSLRKKKTFLFRRWRRRRRALLSTGTQHMRAMHAHWPANVCARECVRVHVCLCMHSHHTCVCVYVHVCTLVCV